MNNPLVQKAQYYLNESNRLNEAINEEKEYVKLLEKIILNYDVNLLEATVKKIVTKKTQPTQPTGPAAIPLTTPQAIQNQRNKRLGQLVDLARNASRQAGELGDNVNIGQHGRFTTTDAKNRAIAALRQHGFDAWQARMPEPGDKGLGITASPDIRSNILASAIHSTFGSLGSAQMPNTPLSSSERWGGMLDQRRLSLEKRKANRKPVTF